MSIGDRLFYMPTHSRYGRPEVYELEYETVRIESEPGVVLHGWFFPAKDDARGTVVHCHGNAGNITGHFEHVKWLPEAGWNVLCFDYRGYGESTGKPTRRGTIVDAKAAIGYVTGRADVDSSRVVVLGQSLGGAIGIVAVAESPTVRGLAVEGAFSHYQTEAAFVVRQSIVLAPLASVLARGLISTGDEPIDCVGRIAPRPTMFVCGTADRIVAYEQTIALHDRAGEPKSLHVIEGGGHVDSMCTPEGKARMLVFFERCVA